MTLYKRIDFEAYLAGNLLAKESMMYDLLHLLAVAFTVAYHGITP